jgi:quercetin dioxygenase-like cupin family protein
MKLVNEEDVEDVEQAEGLCKKVLVGTEGDGARNALRRFVLEPNARVPRHTNSVEHVQYVLKGGYTVEVEGEERLAREGDAMHVPAGAVHSYTGGEERGVFLCIVPNEDDEMEVVE